MPSQKHSIWGGNNVHRLEQLTEWLPGFDAHYNPRLDAVQKEKGRGRDEYQSLLSEFLSERPNPRGQSESRADPA